MFHIDDAERRRRLATRHALAPGFRRADAAGAAQAMTVLHGTDTPTIYLALRSRVEQITPADVDRALYDDRTLIRQLGMRRTLFAVPRDLLGAVVGSAGRRLVAQQRAALVRDVERAGVADDGTAWLSRAEEAICRRLSAGEQLTAPQLRAELTELEGAIDYAPGKSYGGRQPLAPRVLTVLSAAGRIVRARQTHHWRLNRPTWQAMDHWLGEPLADADEAAGYAALVAAWLRTFGPGTETDLVWWLGATKRATRAALAAVDAVEVSLDGGGTGWVLPDDLDPTPDPGPWVALLPVLDPTTMGWKERGFYLDHRQPRYFDSIGNAGTSAWVDGRVVGTWIQDETGLVTLALEDDVPAWARRELASEAERLTAWCEGVRIASIWVSPAMKEAAGEA